MYLEAVRTVSSMFPWYRKGPGSNTVGMSYLNRGPGTVSNIAAALPPGAEAGHFPYDAGGGGAGNSLPLQHVSSSLHLGTSPAIGCCLFGD